MCGRTGLPFSVLYCGTCGGFWEQTSKQPSKSDQRATGKSRGKQDTSKPPNSARTPRGQRDRTKENSKDKQKEDFPQLVLPCQPPPPPKKTEEEKEEQKADTNMSHVAPVLTPPPGNFGGPQIFAMSNSGSASTTPKSLRAVEQVMQQTKDFNKETKDSEGSEMAHLAQHLQQLVLNGELTLPDRLQHTVMQLKDIEQPKEPSMFSLENQRRKWQKKLQQHQENLQATHAAWSKFIAEVTRHIATKEEQFHAIRLKSEQGITEAHMKLGEIAQSMQEQIPKESDVKIKSPEETNHAEPLQMLKEQLQHAQEQLLINSRQVDQGDKVIEAPKLTPSPAQPVTHIHDVESDGAVSVHSQDDDMAPWEEVRPRSRSRQENADSKSKRRQKNRNQHPHSTKPSHPGKKK